MLERRKNLVLYYIVSKIEKYSFLISSKIIILWFVKTAYCICVSIKWSSSEFWCSVLFALCPEHNLFEKYLQASVLPFQHIIWYLSKIIFLHTHLFSYFYLSLYKCTLYLNDLKNQLSCSNYKFRGHPMNILFTSPVAGPRN